MGTSALERDWLLEAASTDVPGFYAEIGVGLPHVMGDEAPVHCFANPGAHNREDRNKSCSINVLTGLWCCQGCGWSGNAYAAAVALGYPEHRAAELARRFGLFVEQEKPKLPGWRQHKAWKQALWAQPKLIERLHALKGWTPNAIQRCGLGWDGERITFTIRRWTGSAQKIVGVARYLPGGEPKMKAIPGSKRELFPPPEMMMRNRPVFLCEGEPDAVSVRSAGHQGVAVPGAGSWRPEWARRLMGYAVIVLCDCDRQGRELGRQIGLALPSARVVDLEPDRDDGYDVGDMVREASAAGGVWQVRELLDGLAA